MVSMLARLDPGTWTNVVQIIVAAIQVGVSGWLTWMGYQLSLSVRKEAKERDEANRAKDKPNLTLIRVHYERRHGAAVRFICTVVNKCPGPDAVMTFRGRKVGATVDGFGETKVLVLNIPGQNVTPISSTNDWPNGIPINVPPSTTLSFIVHCDLTHDTDAQGVTRAPEGTACPDNYFEVQLGFLNSGSSPWSPTPFRHVP